MTLAAGTRIGPYEIQAPLGAGGMGEVYRARDTKLAREVAIKILPDDWAHDAARVARFQREAQLLAALNHPHIAQVYGFEDSTEHRALVMELVEGPTVADRLAQGAIPLDEALPIARQIAEALEAAHEQGIVHRDLKPANIKVRPDGTVKVLDFGLAKLRDGSTSGVAAAMSHSPTITSPALATGAGVILGTAAYMAPEQARGKDVDKRADIWAFGCVLYEMLTGRRIFAADEVSDTLAMVLMKEVDWSPLPASTPAPIRTLLRRCLEKDRKRRMPDIGVARFEIDEALAAPAPGAVASDVSGPLQDRHRGRPRLAWGIAALAGVAAFALAGVHFFEALPAPPPSIRFQVGPPANASMPANLWNQAVSPDGRYIAFNVQPPGGLPQRLAIRAFEEETARELPGTEGAAVTVLFWSPDSRSVGFFADGQLKKIDVLGGPPQVVCDLPSAPPAGGSWGADGTILLGQNVGTLLRVSSSGGTPVPVTMLDETRKELSHGQPWFLPDGRRFLYRAITAPSGQQASSAGIYVGSLDGEPPVLAGDSDAKAQFVDGFLLRVRGATLLAQPFDPTRRTITGDPVVVAQEIATNALTGGASYSVSATGVLSYRRGESFGVSSQLTWIDRRGMALNVVGESADQTAVELSPDGTRVAVSVYDPGRRSRDIWVHDLIRGGLRTRFTFDAGDEWASAWSPDGQTLVFSAGRPAPLELYQKNADGSGTETRISDDRGGPNKYVASWSQDGRVLLYHSGAAGSQSGNDVWVLPLSNPRTPRALLQTRFNEAEGRFSPDGRWVAYRSNESGRAEVYVASFSDHGGKWQVSIAGGEQPRWRRDGRELFYLAGNTVMAAEVDGTGAAFRVGSVTPLFQVQRRTAPYTLFGTGYVYDVTPDGQRFLVNVIAAEPEAAPPITVITNWPATLR